TTGIFSYFLPTPTIDIEPGFLGQGFSSGREFCGLVREHRRNGADFIKIMISGLMDFRAFGVLTEEGLPAAEIRELVSICHGEGFSVMAHANGARTVEAAAAAGVDSIEHGAYLDAEALAAMAACGTVWVPTLSTVANLRRTGRYDDGVLDAILDSFYENLHAYCALGGLLAPGTDAGAPAVPHAGETELALLAPFPLAPGTQTLMDRF
ncbi:MAG: amidohydrolase family protein, partial [Firmicutes bacterium]|nr:amidohydrolase family protein [Bacillota bacterium]